jgi:alanyl-tRNA synthetase
VSARVDVARRAATIRNHSATHLMHKALRDVLGAHVAQKGSLVDAGKTRFDFSHNAPMTAEEIARVERQVNDEVLANAATRARMMAFDDAVKGGAMALFGEKYGDTVRVLDIGASRELCGGTHVSRTGDIGLFKIVSEGGVAAGIRRVEAVTGTNAVAWVQQLERTAAAAGAALKVPAEDVPARAAALVEQIRTLEKELARTRSKLLSGGSADLSAQAVDVGGVKVVAATVDGVDGKQLREAVDALKGKLGAKAAIVLAAVADGKVSLVAGVGDGATARVKAGELVNFVAQQVGGKGGGRADMAMAGGTNAAALPAALGGVVQWVKEKLA